jgi:hypothetical protein
MHFVFFGIPGGLQGRDDFNPHFYRNNYSGLWPVFGSDISGYYYHYINDGFAAGLRGDINTLFAPVYDGVDFSPVFDIAYYSAKNADISSYFGTDYYQIFMHFFNYGMTEGRRASNEFDVSIYRSNYPGLVDAYGGDLRSCYYHYIYYGVDGGLVADKLLVAALTGINITAPAAKTTYFVGESFDATGLGITADYDIAGPADVTDQVSFIGFSSATPGVKTVTVSYTEGDITKTATFDVTVKAKSLDGIAVTAPITKDTYFIVIATYDDLSTVNVTEEMSISGFDSSTPGVKTLTVSYTESGVTETTTFDITVKAKSLTGIAITTPATKSVYKTGESFDPAGLVITASYDDSSTADVTAQVTATGFDSAIPGVKTVTVTYTEGEITQTAAFDVTVNARVLSGIAITTPVIRFNYFLGDKLDTTGLVVTATYDDSSTADVTAQVTFSGFDSLTEGTKTVTISHTENGVTKTAEFFVAVNARTLTGIAVTTPPSKTTYFRNTLFDPAGMVVTASYQLGDDAVIENSMVTTDFNSATVGTHTVTVSYTEGEVTQTATFQVTIAPPPTVYNSVDYAAVYDFDEYVARYPGIASAYGATNYEGVLQHFVDYGIPGGLQGRNDFNPYYYRNNNHALWETLGGDISGYYYHYIQTGQAAGLRGDVNTLFQPVYEDVDYSRVFDLDYYMANNTSLAAYYGVDYYNIFLNFLQYGMTEGQRGNEEFNVFYYRSNYPGLITVYRGDLRSCYYHYMQFGYANKLQAGVFLPIYNGVNYAPVFDFDYYLTHYPEVGTAYGTTNFAAILQHFINFGMPAGLQACEDFNPYYYRNNYNGLWPYYGSDITGYYHHYIQYGKPIGLNGKTNTLFAPIYGEMDYETDYRHVFDINYYLSNNPDLASSFGDDYYEAFLHFLRYGMAEGRKSSPQFDVFIYRSNYPGLVVAYGDDLASYYYHYIQYGVPSGLNAATHL